MILTTLQVVLFTCAVVYVIVASKWLRAMSDWRDEQQRRIDDLQCRVNATEEVLAEHLRRMRERPQEGKYDSPVDNWPEWYRRFFSDVYDEDETDQ